MSENQAFRLAAICWVIYALATAVPVAGSLSTLLPAISRAGLGLLIAWLFWSRPGRGIAIAGTILGLFAIPLAYLAVIGLSTFGPLYLVAAAAGLLVLATSAYCWWLTTRSARPSS